MLNQFFSPTSYKQSQKRENILSKQNTLHPAELPLFADLKNHLIDYPTPSNLNYFYGFGSLAGIMLVVQIVTGIFLTMHYASNVAIAFDSVEHIMRDVQSGWFLRYLHANGASFFFVATYIHIGRGLFYGSYRYFPTLWLSGVVIYILMMGTAFIGYVLPWGQMSFWGATVITNLVTALPSIGTHIAHWVWGGYSVDNATLNRFLSLHYLLPFVIAALSALHLAVLHINGSSNSIGSVPSGDVISFHPYYTWKDTLGFTAFFIVYLYFVFFEPNTLGHPDNYIKANPLVTPAHIVPEWYFLPFYAVLRACPDKIGGIVSMGGALIILMFLPYIDFGRIPTPFCLVRKVLFFCFASNFLMLGWLGANPAESSFVTASKIATVIYFSYFILLFILSLSENLKMNGQSNKAVVISNLSM